MKNQFAVLSMALCVFLLITAEFMPVSLLTPIANSLHATDGMAGQAISISGLFAVIASLLIGPVTLRLDRRIILLGLTVCLSISLILIAIAQNFYMLMIARALLGVVIGAFWALCTSVVMRLVPENQVPGALSIVYMGNAVAVAFAPPLGSWFEPLITWRGVFWALVPFAIISFIWQFLALPKLPAKEPTPLKQVFSLLMRPNIAWGMGAVMLAFMGAFMMFTYFRPLLEKITHVTPHQLSLSFLFLGLSAFAGTSFAGRLAGKKLYALLCLAPFALALTSLAIIPAGGNFMIVLAVLTVWGFLNSIIPVAWSAWLAKDVSDQPEAGGGLLVACIQLAIMSGASLGGIILDHFSFSVLMATGAGCLILSAAFVGNGKRVQKKESC